MFPKSSVQKISTKVLKDYEHLKGFKIMRLNDFLVNYQEEFDEGFNIKSKCKNSPYDILCLVDTRKDVKHTMSPERRKKFRRFCRQRREKVKDRYHYCNVFNRIHGYLILEEKTGTKCVPKEKKVISLSLICSSSYSNKKGIGSALMNFMIQISKEKAYTDIILEVSIDHVTPYEDYEDTDDEDESSEEEDDPEGTDPEGTEAERIEQNEDIITRLTKEFIRKTLRHTVEDGHVIANYNIYDEYIEDIIYYYLNDLIIDYEEEEFTPFDPKEPGQYDYGGYFFKKGISETPLIKYYEKFGFEEMPEINYVWKAFSSSPYPTMILNIV